LTLADSDAPSVDPRCDRLRIEADQVTPFHVRNSTLCHKAANVSHADAEMVGNIFDREKMRQLHDRVRRRLFQTPTASPGRHCSQPWLGSADKRNRGSRDRESWER